MCIPHLKSPYDGVTEDPETLCMNRKAPPTRGTGDILALCPSQGRTSDWSKLLAGAVGQGATSAQRIRHRLHRTQWHHGICLTCREKPHIPATVGPLGPCAALVTLAFISLNTSPKVNCHYQNLQPPTADSLVLPESAEQEEDASRESCLGLRSYRCWGGYYAWYLRHRPWNFTFTLHTAFSPIFT